MSLTKFNNSVIRITLYDSKTHEYKDLYYRLYDTPLSKKWLDDFLKIKSSGNVIKSSKVNFNIGNLEYLREEINVCLNKINEFYDIHLDYLDVIDESSLNRCHEYYAVYGERNQEKLSSNWWDTAYLKYPANHKFAVRWPGLSFSEETHYAFIRMNELIHKAELIFKEQSYQSINPYFTILVSHEPKIDYEITDDDLVFLKSYLDFGDLCLGYNTLGKSIWHIVEDEDYDSVNKELIFPQKTWSNELFISMKPSDNHPMYFQQYYEKWKRLGVSNLGFEFGNTRKNKEGYLCIGKIISDQYNELFDAGKEELKLDLSRFDSIMSVEVLSNEDMERERTDPVKRIPLLVTPKPKLEDKEITKISNPTYSMITWILNDICNYACRYCPPNLHNGKNYKHSWDEVKDFVDYLITIYSKDDKKVVFSLSGGEPTMSPFFAELVRKIYESGNICKVTTNLSRSKRFIEENFEYLYSVSCSFHPYYEFKNNTSDEFIEKVKLSSELTLTTVRVMMDPLYWDETITFIERLKKETRVGVDPVMIEEYYGSHVEKISEINYTEEQLLWFKNYHHDLLPDEPNYISNARKEKFKNYSEIVTVQYDNNSVEFSDVSYQNLINIGLTKFFGYRCSAGENSLYISPTGTIKKANCDVGGHWGTLNEWKAIKWDLLKKPVICTQQECLCGADIPIPKCKINK